MLGVLSQPVITTTNKRGVNARGVATPSQPVTATTNTRGGGSVHAWTLDYFYIGWVYKVVVILAVVARDAIILGCGPF